MILRRKIYLWCVRGAQRSFLGMIWLFLLLASMAESIPTAAPRCWPSDSGLREVTAADGCQPSLGDMTALCEMRSLLSVRTSGQSLSTLPTCLAHLTHLETLLFFRANFSAVPAMLGDMTALRMLSLKANRIEAVPSDSLSPSLRWLILTENRITRLPATIGDLVHLRKLMLSFNRLQMLPHALCLCRSLELIRLASNAIHSIPDCLFSLPRLAWLGLGGNPMTRALEPPEDLRISMDMEALGKMDLLGSGASGKVYAGSIAGRRVAIKVYHDVVSDSHPRDEVALTAHVARVPGVVKALGHFTAGARWGLVMEFLPDFVSLGRPPTFRTITRDVYDESVRLSFSALLAIALCIAEAEASLHGTLHVAHGDLYAHNILVHRRVLAGADDITTADVRLSDFGAAFAYGEVSGPRNRFEDLEVLAFGHLLDELVALTVEVDHTHIPVVSHIVRRCRATDPATRPTFAAIAQRLRQLDGS
eukprot:m.260684 g.260684  ORF g.260684 m.260684 type:complete len:477 (+) comp23831_c0_seq1:84-1514(+)